MPAGSVRAAVAAVTFLTRVPVGRAIAIDGADVARGSLLFPVVGLAVGASVGAVALVLNHALPSLAAAGVAVAVGVVVTGAMHLDALADVADASGGTSRTRALEIMRDPRVGTFGAAAIVLDLLLKVTAISLLLTRTGVVQAVAASAALSRAAALPLALLPYVREGEGTGRVLTGRISRRTVLIGVLFAIGAALVLEGRTGLAMTATVTGTALGLALVYRTWLGGVTGDCLGAVTEVSETAALLVAVALA